MLHVTNGDVAADRLRRAGLAGQVLAWRDALHEGPVPGDLPEAELRAVRGRFLSSWAGVPLADTLRGLEARDRLLRAAREAGEDLVLWFEHDLYDLLQVLEILARLDPGAGGAGRVALILAGSFPGIERFTGLGQLTAAQLASLFPTRVALSEAAGAVAREAWRAFRAPDPTALAELAARGPLPLPYLREALVRHLEEYPSTRDGLGRSERQILQVLQATARASREAFAAEQALEERPFLGDSAFELRLRRLEGGTAPLVDRDDRDRLRLTQHGRDVLAGAADQVRLNGIDRWLGGVHLSGFEARWRWDVARRCLVGQEIEKEGS